MKNKKIVVISGGTPYKPLRDSTGQAGDSMNFKNKKVVVIGGGTGVYTVLSGLKKYPVDLSAIVTMTDSGGSTRILREEFGILPPGDIRRALVALAPKSEKLLASLFNYRFNEGSLSGHSFGNLLITALERIKGDFEKAIEEAGKILNIKGEVIPVTLENTNLYALLETGEIIEGEASIDIPKHNPHLKIKKVYLKPQARANKRAISSILKADFIVIGPGDLYSSIIPNLLVKGIFQAIKESAAKKVYVCNLMTKLGETNNFEASDFVQEIENYLGRDARPSREAGGPVLEKVLNYVILNNKKPLASRIAKYEKGGATFVKYNKKDFPKQGSQIIEGNFLRERGFIRHDPVKLTKAILQIMSSQ